MLWAWALGLASPWAEDLGCMSCPVPGGQLSCTKVHDLWSSIISLNHGLWWQSQASPGPLQTSVKLGVGVQHSST